MSEASQVRALYQQLLEAWGQRDAAAFAALFIEKGRIVGFDGSVHEDAVQLQSDLSQIFAQHQTPPYVGKVRGVEFLTPEVAVLSAVAGMVPPGETELNPALNAIQTLVAVKRERQWQIAVFQNTPAAFHGRPQLSEALTEELREVLKDKS